MNSSSMCWFAMARRGVAVAASVGMVACSSFNPYQKSPALQADLEAPTPPPQKEQPAAMSRELHDLHEAQQALNAQREEWFNALSAQSRVRVGSSLGLIGLSTLSLVSGLGASGDDVKRRLAIAGTAGAATYAGTDWWVNPAHERAYIKGYRLLTCQLGLSTVLDHELSSLGSLEGENGQIGALDAALTELDRVMLPMRFARQRLGSNAANAGTADHQRSAAEAEAEHAGALGRSTLENTRLLVTQLKQAGPQLRRRGELIVAAIAQTIQASQKQTPEPDQLLGGSLKKIMKAFTDIEGKKDTAAKADAQDKETADANPSSATAMATDKKDKQPALMASARAPLNLGTKSDGAAAGNDQALARAVAAVYAARRPLAHRLYGFAQARDAWIKLPECSGQDSALSLTPEGPIQIAPGGTQEVQVWNPASSPRFRVSSASAEAELVQRSNGGLWVRVTAGKDAKGEFTLTVSDDKGGEDAVTFKVVLPAKEGDKS